MVVTILQLFGDGTTGQGDLATLGDSAVHRDSVTAVADISIGTTQVGIDHQDPHLRWLRFLAQALVQRRLAMVELVVLVSLIRDLVSSLLLHQFVVVLHHP